MPRIPLIIEPEADELMTSYLWRLAQHNGLSHVSDLLHGYIWPNNELKQYQRQRIRADANNVFPAFYEAVDIPIDPVQFYLDHTIYTGMVPLTTDGWHLQTVTHAFHACDNLSELIGNPDNMLNEFKVCPCCQKTDFETKGFWYYHTFHHMPGVTVCARHNVPLRILYNTSRKRLGSVRLFETDSMFQKMEETSPEWAYHYAQVAAALLDTRIDTDVMIVYQVILNALRNQGLYDNEEALIHYIHVVGCNTLTGKRAVTEVKTRMHGGTPVSYIHTLSFIALCFQTIEELQAAINTIPREHEDVSRFLSLINGKYEIIGDFYRPLLEMARTDTGEHFLTTLTGFNYGWRENSADEQKTSNEKFRELFQNATDGTYHLMSDYNGNAKSVTIFHDVCGKEYQINPRAFLVNGNRCNCERSYSPEEARKLVERHKEFKLINYVIGNNKPCTILHKYCGNTFETYLPAFVNNPKCKRCEMIKDHSQKSIEQLVKDLVGDEYTVVNTEGTARGKVTIRHNLCGKEHIYMSRKFTDGSRCPYCNNFAKDENFRLYVAEMSGGKYKIGQQKNTLSARYEIINTETNEVKTLTRNRILQELTRPTPSPVLPLTVKYPSTALKTHQDIIWDYLTEHYKPDDYICSYEIPTFKEIPEKSMSVEIGLLCSRRKKLFRVYKGHHSIFAFKDVHLSTDEITEILFIKRNGIRYGCIRGKSLAYELGILTEKPKTIYIMSNVYIGMCATHLTPKGFDIRITSEPVLITEENYRTLQFIDLCWETKQLGWENAHDKIIKFAEDNNVSLDEVYEYLPYYKNGLQTFVLHMIEEMGL